MRWHYVVMYANMVFCLSVANCVLVGYWPDWPSSAIVLVGASGHSTAGPPGLPDISSPMKNCTPFCETYASDKGSPWHP